MNEYAASYSHLEKIVNAAQSMRECLVCRICLELFNEPVSIKCGHKFCRGCILKVASSADNATCPFCHVKIIKRSIPRESNKLLQDCVENYKALAAAILDDSGVDVSKPYNKIRHTKEGVVVNEKSDSSRLEVASVSGLSFTNQSTISKVFPSNASKNKRVSARKRPMSSDALKAPKVLVTNTLHKYLSSSRVEEPSQKVADWLGKIKPTDSVPPDSELDEIPPTRAKSNDTSSGEKSPLQKESCNANLPKVYPGCSKPKILDTSVNQDQETEQIDESKFKEVQLRIQEAEKMAKKKKLSQNSVHAIVKTPGSINASAHSGDGDWRRVKKFGKEMQVKTFKSLHVSVEKNTSSAAIDDSNEIRSSSAPHACENVVKEPDAKSSPEDSAASENKRKRISRRDTPEAKSSPQSIIQEYKQHSMDSTPSNVEVDISYMDESRVKEIIGVKSKNSSHASENRKNLSGTPNAEDAPGLNRIRAENERENEDDEDSRSAKSIGNSSTKRKLSLQLKPKPSEGSKSTCSPKKKPVGIINDSSCSSSPEKPERPKSRLSLRLNSKTNESPVKSVKSPVKDSSKSPVKTNVDDQRLKTPEEVPVPRTSGDKSRSSTSSKRSSIRFIKLGRISKPRKKVPFMCRGRLRPKEKKLICSELASGIVVTSVIPVNRKTLVANQNATVPQHKEVKMLSPEKDSQLKFLALDSPDRPPKADRAQQTKPVASEKNQPNEAMEVDEPPKQEKTSRRQLAMNEEKTNSQGSTRDTRSTASKSTISNHEKTVIEVRKDSTETKQRDKTQIEPVDTSDRESTKSSNSSRSSKKRKKSSPVKKKLVPTPEEDVMSIETKQRDKIQTEPVDTSDRESTKSSNSSRSSKKRKKSSPVKKKLVPTLEEDVISISSNDSERRQFVTIRPRRKFEAKRTSVKETDVDSDSSLITDPKPKPSEKKKSIAASPASSPLMKSPSKMKKKRAHVESSNDDADDDDVEDVSSILQEWCNTDSEHLVKKPKVDEKKTDNKKREDEEKDDAELAPRRDSPIDSIIDRFKENDANKLQHGIPSSLNSADMFETNDQSVIQPSIQMKSPKRPVGGNCSSIHSTPSKSSDKENLNNSNNNVTVRAKQQFEPNVSNISEKSENSNKENDCASISEQNPYHVRDSLMNITQEQMDLKRVEKALIGVDLSTDEGSKRNDKLTTPPRKKPTSQQDSDFETENIDATPVVRKRQLHSLPRMRPITESQENAMSSPERNPNVIPAITPMRNRKTYPLCHSTPMYSQSHFQNNTRNITLVCSSLSPAMQEKVQEFVRKFKCRHRTQFSTDVTHVIVYTDPTTGCGQKTSKYIQGIAYQKLVVSFQWVLDCLEQDTLLNEEDEKYDVLDPEYFVCGARKSRHREVDLFQGFVVYCLEPIVSLPINDFKNILLHNGASITNSPRELGSYNDKIKLIVLESDNLPPTELTRLKDSGGVLISFEWVIDSISQYGICSFPMYLFEMTLEEAAERGVPQEYLKLDDEEEEELEEEE